MLFPFTLLARLQDPSTSEEGDVVASISDQLGNTLTNSQALLEKGKELAIEYGPKLLAAIAVFVVGRIVLGLILSFLRKVMRSRALDETLTTFITNLMHMAGLTLVLISALGQLGVKTTSFVAVLGAATLAIGFALQGSLSNFAAGIMLIFFRPFGVGNFIEAGGTSGVVEEVGVFATTLRTGDNKKVVVPNSLITDGIIVNYAGKPTRRVDMVFGIDYGDDIKQAKEVLQKCLDADERVLADPAPTIGVLELGNNSVNIACRPWCATSDYWSVFFDMNERVKYAFDEAGLSFPFPQRDVHLYETKAS